MIYSEVLDSLFKLAFKKLSEADLWLPLEPPVVKRVIVVEIRN